MPHFGLVGDPVQMKHILNSQIIKTQKKVTFNTGEYVAYKVGLPGSFPFYDLLAVRLWQVTGPHCALTFPFFKWE